MNEGLVGLKMTHKTDIKNELIAILNDDKVNFDKFMSLSSEFIKEDKDSVRFSIDADLINRLGFELVARQETAVSELVKNAYDADATKVELLFDFSTGNKGLLTVSDDGVGMTYDELINGFMRISTSVKKKEELSQIYNRKRAGKKGIGRFAAQRLGEKLSVVTKGKYSNIALKVEIDWNDFKSDRDLIGISNRIYEVDPSEYGLTESGTILEISYLRENWSDSQIKRVYRYASDLIQPYPVAAETHKSNLRPVSEDPGFSAIFKRKEHGKVDVIADPVNMYLEHAYALIEGHIDEDGVGWWKVSSKKLNYESEYSNTATINQKQYIGEEVERLDSLSIRKVSFKVYYYITSISHFPKNLTSMISEMLRNYGGVRVYRNGFRVLPYGERYDDWLRLDWMNRNRVLLPPMGNNNFVGFVDIDTNSTGYFEEVASREGLVDNESFRELREFVSSAILSGIVNISFARNIKVFANQKNYKPNKAETESDTVDRLKETLDTWEVSAEKPVSNNIDDDNEIHAHSEVSRTPESSELMQVNKEEFRSFKASVFKIFEKTELYRVLAGLGLAMAEFTHEVKFNLHDLLFQLHALNALDLDADARKSIDRLNDRVDNLRSYTSFFEQSFQSLASNELKVLDLKQVIGSFVETLQQSSMTSGSVRLEFENDGYEFFTKPSHRSNIESILVNLYSNARKAIFRAASSGIFLIKLIELEDSLVIEVSDTGDGLPAGNREKVFEPFFTTSSKSALRSNSATEMLGMGLGLAIVKEIIGGLDGEIFFTDPREGFSTTVKIILPKASKDEIPDDMY